MTEKDKEINDLRREVDRLKAELAEARRIQNWLFSRVPPEKLDGYLEFRFGKK